MNAILPGIASPDDLQGLTDEQLVQLTQEMRDELVRVLSIRPAHLPVTWASWNCAWRCT